MNSMCDTVLRFFASGAPLALVTMMDQDGSVPRMAGARMLVRPDGSIWGTVGGGRYEAEAVALALDLLGRGVRPGGGDGPEALPGAVLDYSLRGVTDMDMICGGSLSLLLQVLPPSEKMKELFAAGLEAERNAAPFVFISRFTREEADKHTLFAAFSGGTPNVGQASAARVELSLHLPESGKLLPGGARVPQSVLDQAGSLVSGAPCHLEESDCEFLLEPTPKPYRILIFGGGHVSRELSRLCLGVDFPVVVLDDRPEYANSERFPGAVIRTPESLVEAAAAAILKDMGIGPRDGVVIVTRGHAHDRDVLAAALQTDAGYIGMIGSKSKRAAVYASLEKSGASPERLARVHSPIGLAIGADTPQEIAVSIAGELIQWRRQARDAEEERTGPSLSAHAGPAGRS